MAYERIARRLGTVHTFTMSGSSQATAAFGSQTRAVRVATLTQPAFIVIGDGTPTAAATDSAFPTAWAEDFTVTPGQKLAVLQAGTAGILTVTELA
jgi:hypothetical protein